MENPSLRRYRQGVDHDKAFTISYYVLRNLQLLSNSPVPQSILRLFSLPFGTFLTRIEIMQLLRDYIRKHRLQDVDNILIIHPNHELKNALQLEENEPVTSKNLLLLAARPFKNQHKEDDKIYLILYCLERQMVQFVFL